MLRSILPTIGLSWPRSSSPAWPPVAPSRPPRLRRFRRASPSPPSPPTSPACASRPWASVARWSARSGSAPGHGQRGLLRPAPRHRCVQGRGLHRRLRRGDQDHHPRLGQRARERRHRPRPPEQHLPDPQPQRPRQGQVDFNDEPTCTPAGPSCLTGAVCCSKSCKQGGASSPTAARGRRCPPIRRRAR